MADEFISAKFGGLMPSINAGDISGYVIIFIGIILFGGFLCYLTWYLANYFKFNKKILLFRKVGTIIMHVIKVRGMIRR